MLAHFYSDPKALLRIRSAPSERYLDGFAATLKQAGFSHDCAQRHLRAAVHLDAWQRGRGYALAELDETGVSRFKAHLPGCGCESFKPTNERGTGAGLFLRYLREIEMVSPAAEPVLTGAAATPLFQGFCDWMRRHRGAREATLQAYGRIIVDAVHALGDKPEDYRVAALRAFVLDRANRHGKSKAKLIVTALRMFLRYLTTESKCAVGLDAAIPTIARWRLSALPRYMPAADVTRVLATCDPQTPTGARDHAILLLLSRLGLRGSDVVALRVGDIDWEQATIQVFGKSRRVVRLPLPQEVGDALLHYLVHARPVVPSDSVFLRIPVPVAPLAGAASVSDIVRRAILRAGVIAPAYGTHVLRHGAATALLAEGASLDSIGVLLRHQSLDTTAHYAKVHINLLRQLAQPWPEFSPC